MDDHDKLPSIPRCAEMVIINKHKTRFKDKIQGENILSAAQVKKNLLG